MADLLNSDGEYSDGSSYNQDDDHYAEEDEYEEESEEIVLEEELPHEEDEYTESDSYEYPYPTSSDDSWAALSSDEAIQKIIEKLPTYSSESSGDEQAMLPPPLQPASDSDAGSFIEHEEEQKVDTITPSQLTEYQPISYLNSIETYNIYIVAHSDDEKDTITPSSPSSPSSTTSITTPLPSTPNVISTATEHQGQAQQDQPPPADSRQSSPEPPSPNEQEIKPNQYKTDKTDERNKTDKTDKTETVKKVIQRPSVNINEEPTKNENDDKKERPDTPREEEQAPASPKIIEPSQSSIPIISEDAAIESDTKTIDISEPAQPLHRGRDAPRRMTKTRVVIKKVAAKRAPKRFKQGMKVRVTNNKKYNLITPYDGVTGIIRYVGVIDNEKMVGIEILDDDVWGDTNGVYGDHGYFSCPDKKGVFLSVKNIKKYIDTEARKKSDEFKKRARETRRFQRNNAQMYGNIVDNLWQQRIDLVRSGNYRVIRKAGPRDFGRIEYFGGDEEYRNALNDHTHFLAPRLTLPKKPKGSKANVTPKPGPREIGRADHYVGYEYDEAEQAKKRARKKMEIEAKKRRKFEQQRIRKLEEGKITRADYPLKKEKKKKKKSGKKNLNNNAPKKRSKSAMPNSGKKKKNNSDSTKNGTLNGSKKKSDGKKKTNNLITPKKKNMKTKSLGPAKKGKENKIKGKKDGKDGGGQKLKLKKAESESAKKKGKNTKNTTKNGTKPKNKGATTK